MDRSGFFQLKVAGRRRLSVQLILLYALLASSVILVFTFNVARRQSERVAENTQHQAHVLATNLSATAADLLLSRDYTSIENLLIRSARFPGIVRVQACDVKGKLVGNIVRRGDSDPQPDYNQTMISTPSRPVSSTHIEDNKMVVWQPVRLGRLLGWVKITYSMREVADMRARIWQANLTEGGLGVLLTTILLVYFLRRPIKTLVRYKEFADTLDQRFGEQVAVDRRSEELERLGVALNKASAKLREQDLSIRNVLRDLETEKSALDQHCIVSITDRAGRITYANAKYCAMSGDSIDELLGRNQIDVYRCGQPVDTIADMQDAMADGKVWHGEITGSTKGGDDYWLDTTIVPFLDESGDAREFVYISTDISERKEAEKNLTRLAAFPENNPNITLSVDAAGDIRYLNPRGQEILSELALGSDKIDKLLPREVRSIAAACIAERAPVREVEATYGGRSFLWTFAPVRGHDVVHGYALEITKRKEAEENARAAIVEKLSAQASNKAKSAFLANMSHEIRTPLTAIIGFSEALLDSNQSMSDRLESIHSITRNGKHLLRIINDILDLSKIEAERLEVEHIEVELFDLIADIRSLALLQAQEKALSFDIEYRFPIPKTIVSDPVRIKQILLNLCSNAIKFTKNGGVRIRVRWEESQKHIQFEVTDTGIGLTDEQQKKIFDAFTQADSSTTRRYGGTGLGLYLSQQLAKRLGGAISVTSTVGEGSCFTVSIAAGQPAEGFDMVEEEGSIASDDEPAVSGGMPRVRGDILLAEDNVDNQRLISMYLRKVGATVTVAENGRQAVQKASENNFDLILMDMQMPVMDGVEATRSLRTSGCRVPIVALTANALREDMNRCESAGCSEFLTKPINRDRFYDVILRYLAAARRMPDEEGPVESTLLADEPEFRDLVVKFVTNLPGILHEVREALDAKGWGELRKRLHDLKAVGGGYGYPQLSSLAAKMEFEVLKENYPATVELFGELSVMGDRILRGAPAEVRETVV
jgi:PAS domain S-box-containing protein